MEKEEYAKQGGSAFPVPSSISYNLDEVFGGMSLRQYYAGLAMQALMADPEWKEDDLGYLAQDAFAVADAMIMEGEK